MQVSFTAVTKRDRELIHMLKGSARRRNCSVVAVLREAIEDWYDSDQRPHAWIPESPLPKKRGTK